jgi:hypothetical protein
MTSPTITDQYRPLVQIVKTGPARYAQHIWYVTHDDYGHAVLGEPLTDSIYRQGYGEKLRQVTTPERIAEITTHIQETAAAVCGMTRDFIAEHPGC